MEFFYTTNPPQQRAGILAVGHLVSNIMIIPPNAENYTVTSLCPGSCTRSVSALYTSLYYTVKNGVFQNTPGALCSPGY